jgi:hypothetical protein
VAGPKRDYFLRELDEGWLQQAVRMGDGKVVRFNMAGKPNGSIELYNLKTDIREKHNVDA